MTRTERQTEAAQAWVDSSRKTIINSCPRFGKIFTTIRIFKTLNFKSILIAMPRLDIAEGWKKDFVKWEFDGGEVEFVTFNSLKHKRGEYDVFVVDELQEASKNHLGEIYRISKDIPTIGLTGTLTKKSEDEIRVLIGLTICYKYDINQGVKEGILTDYQINIHVVELDNKTKLYRKNTITEKEQFKRLNYTLKKLKDEKKPYFFMELRMFSLIQNSLAKLEKTRRLIQEHKNERILVFCGTQEVANKLEIPVYHSGKKDEQVFKDFCNGMNYKHLATIRMAQAGVTILPINRGIVNYINGNPETAAQKICRFLGIEYDNLEKKACIDIICTNEEFEKNRLSTALAFFDESKINYK